MRTLLAALIVFGSASAIPAQVYVHPGGVPTQFGIAGDAGPYYYGRTVPAGPVYTDPLGPVSRMGTVRTMDGSLTGGSTTRTGAPQYSEGAGRVGMGPNYSATGVTGALSGSYRAGAGGVGGLSDVDPQLSRGLPAGTGLATGPSRAAPVGATQPVTYAPAVDPEMLSDLNQAGAIRTQPAQQQAPAENLTYTATYEATDTDEELRDVQPLRTIEK